MGKEFTWGDTLSYAKCEMYDPETHRCKITGAICVFPVPRGEEYMCDTYYFDYVLKALEAEREYEDLVADSLDEEEYEEYHGEEEE